MCFLFCCACGPNERLDAPSIGFVYDFVCNKSLGAGSQVFCSPCVVSLWSGKSLQLLCILPFGLLCLCAISMMFVKKYVGSVYVGGYGDLSKSGPRVFRELYPVSFLVVGECPSGLV